MRQTDTLIAILHTSAGGEVKTTRPNFTKFSVRVNCGRASVVGAISSEGFLVHRVAGIHVSTEEWSITELVRTTE